MTAAETLNRALQLLEAAMQQPPVPAPPARDGLTNRLLAEVARLSEETRGLRHRLRQQQAEIEALHGYAATLEEQLKDFLTREATR